MQAPVYKRVNINPPGRINLKLDGRFQTVVLDDLPQDKLRQLFENGCKYVGVDDATEAKQITVKELKITSDKKPNHKKK